jgi:zinc protease
MNRPLGRGALALFAALVLTAAAPASKPIASPVEPLRFPKAVLTDLGSLKLQAESEADARLSGVQVFFGAGLDRQTVAQSGVAALVAECIARTAVDGATLRDAIAARGGTLQYTIDGRAARYYLEARSEDLPALLGLFARALSAPDFSGATLASARNALTSRVNDIQGNALSVGVEMFRRSYYATSAGLPALGTTASLAALAPDDVAGFFRAGYRRGGASVSAVGRVTAEITAAIRSLGEALPEGTPAPVAAKARPIPENAPRIVARRDVGAPVVVIGFAAPSPGSKDFGAMLVLESLLANSFERTSATTLGAVQRSVGASYLYDGSPASLIVYVNGNRVDPTIVIRELFMVSKSLGSQALSADSLRRFKATAEGSFVTGAVTLSDRSYVLGTLGAQGLGPDAINAALASIERTTAADVRRVAKKYLQRYIVALVLPRSAPEGS